jgi:hypothetical protein
MEQKENRKEKREEKTLVFHQEKLIELLGISSLSFSSPLLSRICETKND